ncbi:hypothetical protein FC19_GL001780 [Liquorilactobacillus aquaticus DSM 21051]|uniref:Uncharacterized protein n=1 Tax=Liquorilactobacillus aquaticus DSM 21051 TaxID=1423725 RepID=A0A0R2D5J2_9LACO|nr:hypothetical protein FC19_GL001780 [Liquorilactobacillus aquaticus DSM 21051]
MRGEYQEITFKTIDMVGSHPRMRGEYCPVGVLSINPIGSPPHARGILNAAFLNLFIFRITPACAGNTVATLTLFRCDKDHPRMRGEYLQKSVKTWEFWGSPPHARGILIIS